MDDARDRDEEATNILKRHVQESSLFHLATPSQSYSRPQPKNLGITPLAKQLSLTEEQTNGHWCSRCEGIWYGYTLEAECPVCGNRHG